MQINTLIRTKSTRLHRSHRQINIRA